MARQPLKVRLTPNSDVAVAVREANRQRTPIEFEEGSTTYRFLPDTDEQGQARGHDQPESWFKQPTADELARRQEVGARILANRKHRVISPYTAADLVHAAREKRTWDE